MEVAEGHLGQSWVQITKCDQTWVKGHITKTADFKLMRFSEVFFQF